jgi:hypothetical protein
MTYIESKEFLSDVPLLDDCFKFLLILCDIARWCNFVACFSCAQKGSLGQAVSVLFSIFQSCYDCAFFCYEHFAESQCFISHYDYKIFVIIAVAVTYLINYHYSFHMCLRDTPKNVM